jgi:hypothetical protein
MKMRWWIAILLLLNAMALAWQWDAFTPWGWGPNVQREPERLNEQIKPETLQITLPGKAFSAPAASEAPANKSAASEATPSKANAATPVAGAPAAAASAPTPAKPAPQ